MTITVIQSNETTRVEFTITGIEGWMAFANITLTKQAVAYGRIPEVYIDNQLAQDQGYSQDDENFYVWFTTHLSTHRVEIVFRTPQEAPPLLTPQLIGLIAFCAVTAAIAAFFVDKRKGKKPKES
jgi:hypothetical protein